MEAYLSRDQPRWTPKSEGEIKAIVEAGVISESHFIDVKRETGSSPGARKETAKDLASFAIDGGALLIGVEEDKARRTFSLAPQPLEGVLEKIDQIAAMAIDPPLSVISTEIVSDADPSAGYVLVHIPPSPFAPHMVDGRYYARAERTTRILAAPEVLRLHARRESFENRGAQLLDVEVERDHVPKGARQNGHLYLVAHPLTAPRSFARNLVRNPDMTEILLVVRSAESSMGQDLRSLPPGVENAIDRRQRAEGVALCSYAAGGPGRALMEEDMDSPLSSLEDGLLDIEFREDGGIRLTAGRMTMQRDSLRWAMDGLAVAYARRIVTWAAEVGQRLNYRGFWLLGIHASGLRGAQSINFHEGFSYGERGPSYDAESYREVTTASHLEMRQRPAAVTGQLVGRLLDGLGTRPKYDRYLHDAQET